MLRIPVSIISIAIFYNPIIGSTGLNIEANQNLKVALVSVLGQTVMEPFTVVGQVS